MSLLHLVHKNVVIKFSDAARYQFNPEAAYVFRLTGVDAMGFLRIQGQEAASEPYWINKDLIREIRELDLAKVREALHFTGQSAKLPKAKSPSKPKSDLKQKPDLS